MTLLLVGGEAVGVEFLADHGRREIIKNLFSLRMPVLSAGNEMRAIRMLDALGIETMKIAGFGERGLRPDYAIEIKCLCRRMNVLMGPSDDEQRRD